MIQIFITPDRVEKVLFVSQSEAEEDRELRAWRVIRSLVDEIDGKLQQRPTGGMRD